MEVHDYYFLPASVTMVATDVVKFQSHTGLTTHRPGKTGVFESEPVFPMSAREVVIDQPGTHVYTCRVHPTQMQGTITTLPAPGVELLVRDLRADQGALSTRVHVTVHNVGASAVAGTSVLVQYQHGAVLKTIGTIPVPALGSNAQASVHIDWSTLGKAGDFPVKATVDPNNQVAEYQEQNNARAIPFSVLVPVRGVPGVSAT